MPDLLLEIGTYEMPLDALSSLAGALSLRAREALAENGLREDGVRVFYTPRRLALIAGDLVCEPSDDKDATDTISHILSGVVTGLAAEWTLRTEGFSVGFAGQIRFLVCLYGGEVVPLRVGNVCADRITRGDWRVDAA